jgi:arginyl-tRNA synthetase
LKNAANMNIVFDIGESIALEGNSGPYIEYTYARCMSILSKATDENGASNLEAYELKHEELGVIRHLYQFTEIIEEAVRSYSSHGLCTYLFALSQKFNLFYQTCPILTASSREKHMRLAITKAASILLKKGLTVLGIPALEKM